jgi:outer membrane protein OmpA-like peptidoglycan-associated protein
MQNELARIAATRREERGLIVTLSSGVFFDSGKSALKKGAQTTLTRIADQLKGDDSIKVTVEGHTDNTGTAAKNQTLSEKRAEAVRDFLVSAGVPADRVSAVGKGDTQPIATNKTAAGRQQNRRVELVITQ